MGLYSKRLIIVVNANAKTQANTRGKEVDTRGGEHTFTVGLSVTGKEPATHYWCSWAMRDDEKSAVEMKLALAEFSGKVQIFDGKRFTPEEVLAATGLQRIQPDDSRVSGGK